MFLGRASDCVHYADNPNLPVVVCSAGLLSMHCRTGGRLKQELTEPGINVR
jgi:hypothetical protein